MPLGFRLRSKSINIKASRRSAPVTSASSGFGEQEQIGAVDKYAKQAAKYTVSDLVYMCVNRVADLAAMQSNKLKLFDASTPRDPITNIPEKEIEGHPFFELWQKPNVWTSLYDFVEMWAITLQLNGNVFWHLDDGKDPKTEQTVKIVDLVEVPTSLWFVRPDHIVPKTSKEEYIDHYLFEKDGNKIKFMPNSICHFKRFNPLNELLGLSPISPAGYASSSDIAAQKSNYALFKNAMRLSGIIESERDEVDPDQVKLMKRELTKMFTGDPEKAHQLGFLWSDFKYKEMGISPRDAEFIQGAKLNRSRIFGVFGVHPAIILSEDVNRANAEVGEYVTLKFTIEPLLKRLAAGITRILPQWSSVENKQEENIEAHFVGVIPSDDEGEAKVTDLRATTLERLIKALGPDEGVEEAKRQGVVSDDVDAASVVPASAGGFMGRGSSFDEREQESEYP